MAGGLPPARSEGRRGGGRVGVALAVSIPCHRDEILDSGMELSLKCLQWAEG